LSKIVEKVVKIACENFHKRVTRPPHYG